MVSPTASGDNLEVEVKFLLPDLAAFRQRLLAAGAILHTPRTYERNVRYDNAWNGLIRKGELLRLRQDQAARLTFKGVAQQDASSEAKVRLELEIGVSDLATAAAILEHIGFEPRQVYEKYRETFTFGEVEVVLDEMPFGNFVELEGEEAAIRAAAAELELEWPRRILDNYLLLMARLKAHHNLPFDDLTFENFAGLNVSIGDILV
ncbi:MAG: class IV adenylate cyclase [Chloroflexi bacterium]|nr:class IV adenylate cyclase [Chloroflexota bacterium]MCI0575240.1 class IV adenylate cyclase [Chloroflexota bacterium]MCI0648839.1 class IV adenylate cyclase [Chloroflexota bacterium]MCI0726594.1 class IV adenylate cyclase [Chloroflexota bacterium]